MRGRKESPTYYTTIPAYIFIPLKLKFIKIICFELIENIISINKISLLEILPSKLILLYKIIITANTKPRQRMLRIVFNEIMGTGVEFSNLV